MIKNKVNDISNLFVRERMYYIFIMVYCISYVVAINKLLLPEYYVGSTPIVEYGKFFSMNRLAICMSLIFILSVIIKKLFYFCDIASLIIDCLFIIYTIPTLLLFCVTKQSKSFSFIISYTLYWVILIFISSIFIYRFRITKTLIFIKKNSIFNVAIVIVVIFFAVYMNLRQGGFNISLELNSGVYQQRALYKASNPGIWAYVKSTCGIFLCPTLIAYYTKKNIPVACSLIFMQILLFSIAKDKSYFLLGLIGLGIGMITDKIKNIGSIFSTLIVFICMLVCTLSVLGIFSNFLFQIVIRRQLFMPSWLNYLYYEYFLNNNPIWWRQDTFFIDKFFAAPYSVTTSKLIDLYYLKGMVGNPNAGMFAEAMSRCGLLGIFIYPVIFSIILKWIVYISRRSCIQIKMMFVVGFSLVVSNDTVTSTGFVMSMIAMSAVFLIFSKENSDEVGKIFVNSTNL